ncbi:hypothetical protein EVAR_361_1 [Eumeta japonica]|uniref:Uncharacterized protein n=1 Tax=Eumeta variegata TaxID=151549 RepID=A0A4C1SA22_EUMVA|nr:hypothetical protein EVAR_361_1 [Eumeta japonica]
MPKLVLLLVEHSLSVSIMSRTADVVFGRHRRNTSLTQIVNHISTTTFELDKPVISSARVPDRIRRDSRAAVRSVTLKTFACQDFATETSGPALRPEVEMHDRSRGKRSCESPKRSWSSPSVGGGDLMIVTPEESPVLCQPLRQE